jgi:Flp pilus assembly pilin Flp
MKYINWHGQALIEYALILVLISIVVIVALTALGPAISNALYQNIINTI